jgi:excisionase family DNA binding protein
MVATTTFLFGDRPVEYTAGIIRNTEFFTTAELAKKLKMNVQVITRKVQSGEISAFKIGKEWRIPEQSVHEWLESHANSKKVSRKEKVVANFVKDDKVEQLPAQRSKRKYLLEYILAQFEPNKVYTEDEVNRIISRHHEDFCTVRREFIAEGMMDRDEGNYRRRTGYRFSD